MNNTFIFNKDEFQKLQAAFKNKAHEKAVSASDMILYNIIRGKDPICGFTPITHAGKLAGGMSAWQAYHTAKTDLKWSLTPSKYREERGKSIWGVDITEEQRDKILDLLK